MGREPDGGDGPVVPAETLRVAFMSDSQEPLWPETLKLRKNRNEEARQMIFAEILRLGPAAVVHLGDMAALGFSAASWAATDTFVARLDRQRIPFYPILGNHELIFFSGTGLRNFTDRFPDISTTGYAKRFGSMGLILLNSNFSNLRVEDGQKQLAWYEKTLAEMQADSTVGLIVVGCHHSPYTNSTIVTPSRDVQEQFVPPFLRTPKAKLFLSGHAHASEHFRVGGKDFLVLGGGGGLQQPLLTGKESRWKDESPFTGEIRMFHYVRCAITDREVSFTVRMIQDDFSGFHDVETLVFDLARIVQTVPAGAVHSH
jgi:3',5'-cyclic AMP phosphodiesterase CpdA